MNVLRLSELWIYPIKSLGGITLQHSRVLPKGLEYDRRWMLVDEENVCMTQRNLSSMALFKLALQEESLLVSYNSHSLRLPLDHPHKDSLQVKIWDDVVTAFEIDETYNKWFSDMLGKSCKLVYFPEQNERPVDPRYAVNGEAVSLADAFPFLIIGQQSLDDLNERLNAPIRMNRFRPNFVFAGGEPFEEDGWRAFKIGGNRFIGVKPCARCIVPTINQETGEKGSEPLKTLASYRQRNKKILVGQNVVAVDHGSVSVGDAITLM